MRLQSVIWLATVAIVALAEPQQQQQPNVWSWNGNTEQETNYKQTYSLEANAPIEDQSTYNDTGINVDEVVDTILSSNRQGRNLDGFDEVYADPTVQDALQKGDDTQARNLIKDKLCSLGLMQCDNEESIDGKRPFGDYIYASPPNGPYRGPGGPPGGPPRPPTKIIYGPPRPMPGSPSNYGSPTSFGPPPSNFGSQPPKRVGYAGSRPPSYNGPYLDKPPSNFGGPIYHSKPPGPIVLDSSPPYKFVDASSSFSEHSLAHHQEHHDIGLADHSAPKPTIVVNAHGGAANTGAGGSSAANSLNIHHHYHHIDGASKAPTVVVNNPVPVPVPSGNGLISSEFSSHGGSSIHEGGFNPLSSGYDQFKQGSSGFSSVNSLSSSGIYGSGVKPVIESGSGFENNLGVSGAGSSFGGNSFGSNSAYGQSVSGVYNGNAGGFQTSDHGYYKKALNTNSGLNSLGSGYKQQFANGGYAGQYSGSQYNQGEQNYLGLESARQDNFDCVCVPFDQCPARDVFGRKDDLILPLDPRNLGTDIEALSDDTVTDDKNGTTAARVTKEASDDKVDNDKKDVEVNKEEAVAESEKPNEKSRRKRDISEKKSDDLAKADGEARIFGLGGIGGIGGPGAVGGGLTKKKVEPQFGVSFGLPYPSGGYPLNTFNGGYPAQNPYFGSISPNGLNLGLVNVNPLVSFQFAKNEYGEKLFKPLVNFHVTPNEGLIHKVGSLFKHKKHGGGDYSQGNLNQHYHTHTHYPVPPPVYHPHHHHGGEHYEHFGGEHYYGGGGHEFIPSGPGPAYGFGPHYRDSSPYASDANAGYYSDNGSGYSQPDYQSDVNGGYYSRSANNSIENSYNYQNVYPNNNQLQLDQSNGYAGYASNYDNYNQNSIQQNGQQSLPVQSAANGQAQSVSFPNSRRKRNTDDGKSSNVNVDESSDKTVNIEKRQAFNQIPQQCGPRHVCCRRPARPTQPQQHIQPGQCGRRNTQGITGRIKNPVYVDGDSEFGEYPWQAAILKKDPKESVYVCGGTLIDGLHIITAAHCVKTYTNFDLRIRLGEWDVNHDVEFFPYIERDVIAIQVHPQYYAGTLDNDLAILKLNSPVDFVNHPHISPACLPDKYADFTGQRCWTTGWGKDAFGDFGKYQNILKEVDVPIINQQQCQQQLRNTRLGYTFNLNPGFVCAGGEEGKDACKGDGGGPMVCERNGIWQLVGVVSWGIGCGQVNVPGVYVRTSFYLDWIQQVTQRF